jgi:hypothetical protein
MALYHVLSTNFTDYDVVPLSDWEIDLLAEGEA